MKKPLLALVLLLGAYWLSGQTQILGNLRAMEGFSNEVYLLAITDYENVFASTDRYTIDTAVVSAEGDFTFTLKSLPCTECLYRIDVRPEGASGPFIYSGTSKENFALFELREGETLRLSGEAHQLTKSLLIESESDTWTYADIRSVREPVYAVGDRLNAQFTDPAFLEGKDVDSLEAAAMQELVEVIERNNTLLLEHMTASASIYDKVVGSVVYDYDMSMENDLAVYEEMSEQLAQTHPGHPYLLALQERIRETKFVLPTGSEAPSLSLPDAGGQEVDVRDVAENLLLIDFWASWCAPCRRENRLTVNPLHAEYKDQGFAVYSVSLDDDREKWLQAVEKDGMDWTNVSDLLGSASPVYDHYKIDGLPTSYLVEWEGFKIVAKDIRGEELTEFVKAYYGE